METEKKSELILLRLPPSLDRRLTAAAQATDIGRQHIIRSALSTELARLEAHAAGASAAELRALADYRRLTGGADPVAALKHAARTYVGTLASRAAPVRLAS